MPNYPWFHLTKSTLEIHKIRTQSKRSHTQKSWKRNMGWKNKSFTCEMRPDLFPVYSDTAPLILRRYSELLPHADLEVYKFTSTLTSVLEYLLELGYACSGSESICRSWVVQVSFPCWEYDCVTGEQLQLGGKYGVNITSPCEAIDGSFGLSCMPCPASSHKDVQKLLGTWKLSPTNSFGFPPPFKTMSNGPCILCKNIQLYKASRVRKFGHTWLKWLTLHCLVLRH